MLTVMVLVTLLTTVFAPKIQLASEMKSIDTSKEIQEIRASLMQDNYDYVQEPVPRHGEGLQTSSAALDRFSVARNAGDRRPEQDVSFKWTSRHTSQHVSEHSEFVYREVKPITELKTGKVSIEEQMTKKQIQKKNLVTKIMFDRKLVQRRMQKNVMKMEGMIEYQNISQKENTRNQEIRKIVEDRRLIQRRI